MPNCFNLDSRFHGNDRWEEKEGLAPLLNSLTYGIL